MNPRLHLRTAFLVAFVFALAALRPPDAAAQARVRFDAATAPDAREIIRALIGAHQVPIAQAARCRGAAGDDTARDIGDYVADIAALLVEDGGRNWIATTAEPARDPAHGGAVWRVGVSFHRSGDNEDWAWGAAFVLRGDDHTMVPGTIVCIGMG